MIANCLPPKDVIYRQGRPRSRTCLLGCAVWSALALVVTVPAAWAQDARSSEPSVRSAPDTPSDEQSAKVEGYALRLEQKAFDANALEKIKLPDGFRIRVFAKDLERPRMLAVGAEGTVYVAEQAKGQGMPKSF